MIRNLMRLSLWPISPCAKFEGDDGGDGGGGGAPVAYVDHEGNFSENWLEGVPEDVRDAPCLKEVANLGDLAKQHVHAQRNIGKDKVVLPGENASDDEWSAFYTQVGKPKSYDGYKYERPEEVPEDQRGENFIKEAKEFAFENNLTQKQFARLMAQEDARLVDSIKTQDDASVRELEEAEKVLKDKWGMAYEERIHVVNRFINETTDEGDERDAFIAEFGRNPKFVEWAAKVGVKLIESDLLIADLTQKAPKEAQAELDELMASEDYTKYLDGVFMKENPTKHANIQKKLSDLFDIIHPEKKG